MAGTVARDSPDFCTEGLTTLEINGGHFTKFTSTPHKQVLI